MRIYISGKIGDLPVEVFTLKFKEAEKSLIRLGHDTINPVEISSSVDCLIKNPSCWDEFMLNDIAALFKCDAIYMLSCWQDSPGARVEHSIAKELGKVIFYEATIL